MKKRRKRPWQAAFVGAIRQTSFPRWERYEKRPERELAFLSDGLLPI